MIIDAHVHAQGNEDRQTLLNWMEKEGLDKIVLLSPYPTPEIYDPVKFNRRYHGPVIDSGKLRENAKFLSGICKESKGKIIPFLYLDPTIKEVNQIVKWAVEELGIKGLKMIPNGWHPWEERFKPLFKTISKLRVPVLFHSGILSMWGDTSRFCRPCEFEFMMNWPEIKFMLAHIGWPWVDECLAVAQKIAALRKMAGMKEIQCFVDITPGTPPLYRENALRLALELLGSGSLIFGTDSTPQCGSGDERFYPKDAHRLVNSDMRLLKKSGCTKTDIDKIFFKNIEDLINKG